MKHSVKLASIAFDNSQIPNFALFFILYFISKTSIPLCQRHINYFNQTAINPINWFKQKQLLTLSKLFLKISAWWQSTMSCYLKSHENILKCSFYKDWMARIYLYDSFESFHHHTCYTFCKEVLGSIRSFLQYVAQMYRFSSNSSYSSWTSRR